MQNIPYRTRKEAAETLQSWGIPVTLKTLAKLACVGGGPAYRIFGNKALYLDDELKSWAESRMSSPRTHTSEAGSAE